MMEQHAYKADARPMQVSVDKNYNSKFANFCLIFTGALGFYESDQSIHWFQREAHLYGRSYRV